MAKGKTFLAEGAQKHQENTTIYHSNGDCQKSFFNYDPEDNDGVKITAAFSLSDSSKSFGAKSLETPRPITNSEEMEIANTSQATTSKLLPGGFAMDSKVFTSKDLPIKTERPTYAVTTIPTPDVTVTACDSSSASLPDVSHKPFYSYDNMAYGADGSGSHITNGYPDYKSAVPCSVEHPSSSRRPVTDFLWSYPPQERLYGDTNVPLFPVFSYGDIFPFYESNISQVIKARPTMENVNVFSPKMSEYHNPGPDDHNFSSNRFTQGLEECASDGRLYKSPLRHVSDLGVQHSNEYFSQVESRRRARKAYGEPSAQSDDVGIASELLPGDEDGILRDMHCRGMPSSLSIRTPGGAPIYRREARAKLTPMFPMAKNLSRESSHNKSLSGPAYQTHQTRRTKERMSVSQGPLPNTLNGPLSHKTQVFEKAAGPQAIAPSLAEMEAAAMIEAPQAPYSESVSCREKRDSHDKHVELIARLPNYSIPLTMSEAKMKLKKKAEDEGIDMTKTDEFVKTTNGSRNAQPSCADQMDMFPFILTSEVRSETKQRERKRKNPSTDRIAAEPMKMPQSQRTTENHGDTEQCSSFSSDKDSRVRKRQVEEKRESVSLHHNSLTSDSRATHPVGYLKKKKKKGRFDWDRLTFSLERKRSLHSPDAKEQPSKKQDSLFDSVDSNLDRVLSNKVPSRSSVPLACKTEDPVGTKSSTTDTAPIAGTSIKDASEDHSSEDPAPHAQPHYSDRHDIAQETTSEGSTSVKKGARKKHECDICGKMFTRNNTLIAHNRIHSGLRPYSCDQCGRAFRQQGNLNRHKLTHTTIKNHICSYCNKPFSRASNLQTHLRIHTNYRPFTCDFCDKGFYQKMDMKIHRYTHTGEKPHVCTKCGKGFKQLTHLKYHLRIHSDVRMYKCEYCGKGFNQKGNLQAHIRGHTGERPHKCDICGKGFTLASTLNTHKRTHAATKPFQCEFCSKAYYQKSALKTHYMSTHPYTSGYCIA